MMKKTYLITALFILAVVIFLKALTSLPIVKAVENPLQSEFLFPSARSYGYYLMPYSRFGEYGSGDFPDYSAEDVFNFWLAHHDMIVTGYSPEDYKAAEPDRIILGGDANTFAGFYDYFSDTYYWGGQWTHLYNWIEDNFVSYNGWGFETVDEAFEDCWLHLSETSDPITFTFGHEDRYGTTEVTITPYDPADPTRSRVPGAWSADGWFTNIKSQVYIDFWEDYFTEELMIRYEEIVDGYFLDVLGWDGYRYFNTEEEFENLREFSSKDEYNTYLAQLTEIIQNKLHQSYPGKYLAANTWRNLNKEVEPYEFIFEDNVDVYIREGSIVYTMDANAFEDELKACQRVGEEGRIVARQHMLYYIFDLEGPSIDRSRITGLAAYYLSMNDNVYFFSHQAYNTPADDPYSCWFEAIAYDIGQPDGDYYVFAEGQDPSNPTQTYKVFARDFTKGIVLVKPRPTYYNPTSYISNSKTSHDLNGTYRPLKVDGTLGDPITSIDLRNWEGAILLEVDTTAPEPIDDLEAS